MFGLSFVFLLSAAIAASFGYLRPVSTSSCIAKLFFFTFLFVFFAVLVIGLFNTTPLVSSGASPLGL